MMQTRSASSLSHPICFRSNPDTNGEACNTAVTISRSPSLIAFRLQPADGKSERSLSLNVARYTPQAVLTANIEEAYYSALITADGKMLVQSRFAVRNNQRNFLKITLPAGATLWSASLAGRPIRPGQSPDPGCGSRPARA